MISDRYAVRLKRLNPFGQRADKARQWQDFARTFRNPESRLLGRLVDHPDAVLVAGCQRSGGTMLTHAIKSCESMGDFDPADDRELAGARILVGAGGRITRSGRQCFQTTYLNEHYTEYLEDSGAFRLIWLIRNPESVVRSMLFNWARYALNELFVGCGSQLLEGQALTRYRLLGAAAVSPLEKACLSYNAKNAQLLELIGRIPTRILVVDYDRLVQEPEPEFRRLCRFLELPETGSAIQNVQRGSLKKAQDLPDRYRRTIRRICLPSYERVCGFARENERAGA